MIGRCLGRCPTSGLSFHTNPKERDTRSSQAGTPTSTWSCRTTSSAPRRSWSPEEINSSSRRTISSWPKYRRTRGRKSPCKSVILSCRTMSSGSLICRLKGCGNQATPSWIPRRGRSSCMLTTTMINRSTGIFISPGARGRSSLCL